MPNTIEIPAPLIQVVATEYWKSDGTGWEGHNEYTVVISIGDVELMRRTADDKDEENWNVNLDDLREQTVNEFGERLKEVLGL